MSAVNLKPVARGNWRNVGVIGYQIINNFYFLKKYIFYFVPFGGQVRFRSPRYEL